MTQEPMDMFVEKLLKEANLDGLPEEYKVQYVERLKDQINQRMGVIAMKELDEKGAKDFTGLMDREPRPTLAELGEFLNSRIPDFGEKIRAGLVDFASDFIAAAKKKQ